MLGLYLVIKVQESYILNRLECILEVTNSLALSFLRGVGMGEGVKATTIKKYINLITLYLLG